VLQQALGRDAAAEETLPPPKWKWAKKGFSLRAPSISESGQTKTALADARAVIELNPDSAIGYLVLGQVNEGAGNYVEAVNAYTRASTLAEAQNKLEIAAIARVQLAM